MTKVYFVSALCLLSFCASASENQQTPIDIDSMSLEKTSPFETPTPKQYGENAGLYEHALPGAPSMIPHAIDSFKITRDNNPCMMCHANQSALGDPKHNGIPITIPETHWKSVNGKRVLAPSHYECTLCHATQTDAQPLVGIDQLKHLK